MVKLEEMKAGTTVNGLSPSGLATVTVTRNEILTALNKPDAFIFAIVQVNNGFASEPRYVRQPFQKEPDLGATSVTYKLGELLPRAEAPC